MGKSESQEIAQSPAKDPKIASSSMEAEKKPVIEGGLRDVPTKKSVPLRAIEERSAGQKSEIPTEGAIIPIQTPITPTTTDSAARFFSFSFFSNSRSVRDQSICRMSSPWEYAPIEFIALLSRITQSGH